MNKQNRKDIFVSGGTLGITFWGFFLVISLGVIFLKINPPNWLGDLLLYTLGFPYSLAMKLAIFYGCTTSPCIIIVFLLSIPFYLVFGILIYYIYYLIKRGDRR